MSNIEKLLQGAEVEWKALGDESIGKFIRGGGLQKKDFTEKGVGCIHYGQIYTYYGTYTNKTKTFVSEEFAKKARMAKHGDLVIATTSENDEDVCKAVAWLGEDKIAVSSDACFYTHSLNPKYVAYFFQTEQFQKQKKPFITGTKVKRVNADDLAKIQIPIPCPNNPKKSLEIQKEIVRILDTFMELTAELTARKKQYHYYREALLRFEEGEVEWKSLGEVGEYSKGRINFTELDKNNYVGVDNILQNREGKTISNYVPQSGNSIKYDVGDILIGNIRPYLKKIWHSTQIGGTNGDVLVVRPTNINISPRFLYHILADDRFFEYNMQHAKGAKMPRGNKDKILEYRFPVPPLSEQARIVSILDKFDTLTTSISEGLPKEIALRKKQYEYYRDLLLTFNP